MGRLDADLDGQHLIAGASELAAEVTVGGAGESLAPAVESAPFQPTKSLDAVDEVNPGRWLRLRDRRTFVELGVRRFRERARVQGDEVGALAPSMVRDELKRAAFAASSVVQERSRGFGLYAGGVGALLSGEFAEGVTAEVQPLEGAGAQVP